MESYKVKEAVKFLLKKNSKSYQELSEELDVSLSTVKRMLSGDTFSLDKLGSILSWLKVDFADLQMIIDTFSDNKEEMFTVEQEDFLSSDIRYYNYMSKIISGMTPDEIKGKYNLSDSRNQTFLIELEKNGLIYVTPSGQVNSKYKTTWSARGPIKKTLIKKVNKRMNEHFLNKQLSGKFGESTSFKLGYNIIHMPKSTYQHFVEDLEKIRKKYIAHSNMERKAAMDGEIGTCYLSMSYDFLDSGIKPDSFSSTSFDLYEEIS
ncbi:MAG: helix-turn-helix transcriptional regulator [Halobacteriovoraceae bacterium]|jgi:transcriptional regulator with XRE-family HTH domain|nr:helix-turn-helix transcriptional regulator [Halobacteriovoraceae bacterium]